MRVMNKIGKHCCMQPALILLFMLAAQRTDTDSFRDTADTALKVRCLWGTAP